MKQFSEADIQRLRQAYHDDPRILSKIQEDNAVVLNNPVLVPETGCASWELFYYCPTPPSTTAARLTARSLPASRSGEDGGASSTISTPGPAISSASPGC